MFLKHAQILKYVFTGIFFAFTIRDIGHETDLQPVISAGDGVRKSTFHQVYYKVFYCK